MKIKRNEHFIQFISSDDSGEFKISIQKDCSQVRLETGNGEAFINTNLKELKAMRDCLNEVINQY